MGITDFFSSAWETLSHPSPDAENQRGQASQESPAARSDENATEADANKKDENKNTDSGEQGHMPGTDKDEKAAEEAEAEDEDEEEIPDPKEVFEEECKNTKECSPAKHHFDHCQERVADQIEKDGKAAEDCVEEFFHLAHCATACAAPKLFATLK